MLFGGFYADMLAYWAAVGVIHAIEYYRESRERELETENDRNTFLNGVNGVVEAIKSEKLVRRVYRKDKFHTKDKSTYHGKRDSRWSARPH